MANLQELQILAQLLDNMSLASEKLEKMYGENNAEDFNSAKKEIMDIQNKISQVLK